MNATIHVRVWGVLCSLGLASSALLALGGPTTHTPSTAKLTPLETMRDARLVHQGNVPAMFALTHDLFARSGVSPDIADGLGFTSRVVNAEKAYRAGYGRSISESDLVGAVNAFADTIGAPPWAHTTTGEITRLRMSLVVSNPELFADHSGPDAKGHYHALNASMSPLEVSYIITTLIYQKIYNPTFEMTDSEYAARYSMTRAQLTRLHIQRESQLLSLARGTSGDVSLQDILGATDRLFTQLGMPQDRGSGTTSIPGRPVVKGGR
jgi:hypothetical protein